MLFLDSSYRVVVHINVVKAGQSGGSQRQDLGYFLVLHVSPDIFFENKNAHQEMLPTDRGTVETGVDHKHACASVCRNEQTLTKTLCVTSHTACIDDIARATTTTRVSNTNA